MPLAFDTTDELEAARAQRVERRQDIVGHVLPEVAGDVVGVKLASAPPRRVRERDAGVLEDQIEEQPATAGVGRARRSTLCRRAAARHGARQRSALRRDGDALRRERVADTRHQFG